MLNINDTLIRSLNITDFDVAVYSFCMINTMSGNYESVSMDISDLAYQMRGSLIISNKFRDKLNKSMNHLINEGYIHAEKPIRNKYIIYLDEFNNFEYFTSVDPSDLRIIMQQSYEPVSVLRQYLLVLSTINSGSKCSTYTLDWYGSITGRTIQTVSKYMSVLEDLGLIYIYRSADKYTANVYGRAQDKAAIDFIGRKTGKPARINANNKRRFSQMYNHIKKVGIKKCGYTPEEVVMVHEYMKQRNEEIRQMAAAQPAIQPEYYDLSIFT